MQTALQIDLLSRGARAQISAPMTVAISASTAALRGKIEKLVHRAELRIVAEERKCDVLLIALDSSTSLPTSVAALSLLAPSAASVCVIWIGGSPARGTLSRLLRAGVAGIIPLDITSSSFKAALHAIRAGLQVIHPAFARAESPPSRPAGSPEELTEREQQVLVMLGEGLSNKEISARLAISTHTVKFHISSILGKLGAGSRTEAVSIGIRSGRLTI